MVFVLPIDRRSPVAGVTLGKSNCLSRQGQGTHIDEKIKKNIGKQRPKK